MYTDFRNCGNSPPNCNSLPYRYRVRQITLTDPNGLSIPYSFIILENQWGLPVGITHLQDFVADGDAPSGLFKEYNKKRCLYFCQMLNFILIDNYDRYHISSVMEIDYSMMQEFFEDYGGTILPDGFPRKPETTWECVRVCTFTMYLLRKTYGTRMKVSENDLLVSRTFRDYRGTLVSKMVPNFTAHDGSNVWKDPIFREIPTPALELLLPLAFQFAPDIAFGLCLQAFGGLRPGEVCCVRQEGSPLGPGIEFEMTTNGRIPVIDLTREYTLRSDHTPVGKIKRERKQKVFPDFISAFETAYELHKKYLRTHPCEAEYGPMFVNRDGKALTYETYAQKFDFLVQNHFIPELLKSENPDLQMYGAILQKKHLSPHALRHVFTVQLVLRGLTASQLMYWRGDRSPESSNAYIAGKSELISQAQSCGMTLAESLLRYSRIMGGGRA